MTISMDFFLMIVIPELLLFSIWTFLCISSMELTKTKTKKKKDLTKVFKSDNPHEDNLIMIHDPQLTFKGGQE